MPKKKFTKDMLELTKTTLLVSLELVIINAIAKDSRV
jgi:hypothetical protein